jgi:hypothetical protein
MENPWVYGGAVLVVLVAVGCFLERIMRVQLTNPPDLEVQRMLYGPFKEHVRRLIEECTRAEKKIRNLPAQSYKDARNGIGRYWIDSVDALYQRDQVATENALRHHGLSFTRPYNPLKEKPHPYCLC